MTIYLIVERQSTISVKLQLPPAQVLKRCVFLLSCASIDMVKGSKATNFHLLCLGGSFFM